MVEKCAIKCSEDLCLPEEERVKFTSQHFTFTTDDSVRLWNHFKPLISEYTGDAENVYAVFYGLLCDNNLLPTKFEDLSDINILLSEVGTRMLLHLSGDPSVVSCNIDSYVNTILSEKELSSMQYLSGYVVRKLYSVQICKIAWSI